jgi:hypothetical protein
VSSTRRSASSAFETRKFVVNQRSSTDGKSTRRSIAAARNTPKVPVLGIPLREAVLGCAFHGSAGYSLLSFVPACEEASRDYTEKMAVRQFQLSPEAEPILDSVAASFGGDAGLALSELLIAHESIESFLDEMESSCPDELTRQRDRSAREFRDGLVVPWEKVKLDNGL